MQKTQKGLNVTLETRESEGNGEEVKTDCIEEVDCLLWAIGREPNTAGLNLSQMVIADNFNAFSFLCIICIKGIFSSEAIYILVYLS